MTDAASASKKTPTRSGDGSSCNVATPSAATAGFSASKKDDGLEVSAQAVADFEEELRVRREQLTMFKRPLQTLRVFALAVASLTSHVVRHWLTHPVFVYVLLPLMPTWYAARSVPGPHLALMHRVEFGVEFFVWWVGLGILSSIGLGSGLQSGVLFMFPHIIKTCLAAQTCQTLDFVSSSNMWFRKPANLFKCPPLTPQSTPVTFLGLWLKVLGVCFLQTAGTALGEIPPFWMTRAARLAAIEAGTSSLHDDDVPEELESKSNFVWVDRAKAWIVKFLRERGFYGILVMASIPNPLFDLCGICCGHYLMPFPTFFAATFLGKAVIRNLYQSLMYVALCGEEYIQLIIRVLQYLAPDSWKVDGAIREIIEEGQASFRRIDDAHASSTAPPSPRWGRAKEMPIKPPSATASVFLFYWQCFMSVLLLLFLLSCVAEFAQFHQLTLDRKESDKLRQRLPSKVRETLLSPSGSGRLVLPPPTARKEKAAAAAAAKQRRASVDGSGKKGKESGGGGGGSGKKEKAGKESQQTPSSSGKKDKDPGSTGKKGKAQQGTPTDKKDKKSPKEAR